jgi:polar amino acid transport system permease protein
MTTFEPLFHSYRYLLTAAGMTLALTAFAVIPATVLGLALATARLFSPRFGGSVVTVFLFLMRGIPLLVLITCIYYLLPLTGIDLPPVLAVTLVLALYYAAFMSEVFRAGIDSLPRAQWDAARGLGMGRALMLRVVVFPQALRLAGPPYVNLCVNLVKATSLASVVGIRELTLASREIVERTLAPFQIFIAAAVIYFCICSSLAWLGRRLEKRALAGH